MILNNNYKFSDSIEILCMILVSVSPVLPMGINVIIQFILLLRNAKTIYKKDFKILFLLFFLFCIPIALDLLNIGTNFNYSLTNIMYPFIFLCGYFVGKKYDYDYFMFLFERIIFILACLSLIGMSIFFISPSWIYKFPTYIQNGATHRTILIFNYLFVGDWMAVRNSGIAWEPGVFQLLLNMGLLTLIRSNQRKKILKIAIYILSIYLTKSTVGLFLLAINVLLIIKENKRYLPLLIFVIIIFSNQIYSEYLYQLTFKLRGSMAFGSRYDPSINAIKYSWYKFYGIGATRYNGIYEAMGIGSYDAYTQILMRFGYPLLLYVVYAIYSLKKSDIVMSIFIFVSFLGEPLWGTILFTSIYFIRHNNYKNKESFIKRY